MADEDGDDRATAADAKLLFEAMLKLENNGSKLETKLDYLIKGQEQQRLATESNTKAVTQLTVKVDGLEKWRESFVKRIWTVVTSIAVAVAGAVTGLWTTKSGG